MSDISPRRRSIGKWSLAAGAALALPLTATVVYAGQDAPEAPAAPSAPAAPAAPKVFKKVIVLEHRDHTDGQDGAHKIFERRVEKDGKTIVIRSPKPIEDADFDARVARIEAIEPPEPPIPPEAPHAPAAPGERREFRKMILGDGDGHDAHDRHERIAFAVAMNDCNGAQAWADASYEDDGHGAKSARKTRVVLCGKAGEARAQALAGVRRARADIAANRDMADEIRKQVLESLDVSITDLEEELR